KRPPRTSIRPKKPRSMPKRPSKPPRATNRASEFRASVEEAVKRSEDRMRRAGRSAAFLCPADADHRALGAVADEPEIEFGPVAFPDAAHDPLAGPRAVVEHDHAARRD